MCRKLRQRGDSAGISGVLEMRPRGPFTQFRLGGPVSVHPRFRDQPGKDAIGLPWESVPGTLDEIERIGDLLS
jgi:hypothetical protein